MCTLKMPSLEVSNQARFCTGLSMPKMSCAIAVLPPGEPTFSKTTTLVQPNSRAVIAALRPAPFTVGFAAETEHLEAAARAKLAAKGVDLIAANLVGGSEGGFGVDENRLLLVDRQGTTDLPLATKTQLARALIQHIAKLYRQHEQHGVS